jgi:hypothetical protein
LVQYDYNLHGDWRLVHGGKQISQEQCESAALMGVWKANRDV